MIGMNWAQFIAKYWVEVGFGLICGIFGWLFRRLSKKVKDRTTKDLAMEEATLSMLDDRMGQIYNECRRKGYATREESRRYERMYIAYHNLGGNGAVTAEHDKFKALDIKDE